MRINKRTYVSSRAWNPDWLDQISDGVDGDVTSGLGNLRNDNDLDGDVQEKVNPSS